MRLQNSKATEQMNPFEKLKHLTRHLPFKDSIRPLYMPLLNIVKSRYINKKFNSSGVEVLINASQLLDEIGVFHWLEFGTLLGVVRDGKLIKHDSDLDLGVFISDYNPKIKEAFVKAGFEYKHGFSIADNTAREETFMLENVSVDLFYFTQSDDTMHCHIFGLQKDKTRRIRQINTIYSGFKKIAFEGKEFNIPQDEIQRLIDTYGTDYTIPIKGWHTPNDALNSEIINKEVIYN